MVEPTVQTLDLNAITIDKSGASFARVKVFKKNLFSLALIDSGNLSTSLISEEFFKQINTHLV